MQHSEQIAIAERLLEYIDNRATARSEALYRQPVEEYTSRVVAAQEQAVLFRARPQCVGLAGLLPAPGSFATHDIGAQPLLLTRAADGRFRAFLNVCRHRGARVATGCGSQRSFVCPYHAWAYGLDGRLLARPEDDAFAAAPRAAYGLTSLPCAERDGLLWVHPDPGATLELDDFLAGLDNELAGYDLGRFHHYASRVLTRRMNWKLLLDTFL
ncbi:MAG: Rieske (2Fe-2S) protein, partial [Gammaproteobacteria bacterium]